ncbi:hypothetical protein [uncultured Rothia sp.]|uniref:hypothetical protein n=1 Tax=uncultured Rothia sp. TaxID=316088 RepID=UPI0032179937
MNQQLAPVVRIPRAHRATMQLPRQVAVTGEKPIYALCSDGEEYWCKKFDLDVGGLTVVNEVVASEIGKLIGAPIIDWAVIDVPDELQGRRALGSDTFYPSLPMFGSKHIKTSISKDVLMWVDKDGNFSRIPSLIGLWHLCNADDTQVIYDAEADTQIYSIDHGYWFDSYEGKRIFSDGMTLYEPLPLLRGRIPNEHWEQSIVQVGEFANASTHHIFQMMPNEWGVNESEIVGMVDYAKSRVEYTIGILEEYRAKYLKRG